jgi:hypothetical protein
MPQYPQAQIAGQTPSGPFKPVQVDDDGHLVVTLSEEPSPDVTFLASSSGNKANTNAVATLHPSSGKTASITGFQLTAAGATAALAVTATVTGVVGGPLSYTFTYPIGVAVPATPLNVKFDPPLPATAADTDIVVTLPASGTGGTNAAASAQGLAQ